MSDLKAHESFAHTVLLYDGRPDLVDQLRPMVAGAVERREPVLLCLDPQVAREVLAPLGEVAGVTVLAADDRYARPTGAMAALGAFVARAREGGRPVWSIGEIGFGGAVPDGAWLRYEEAVNDVLAHLPVRCVCAYDRTRLDADLLEAACHVHPDDVPAPRARTEPGPWLERPSIERPAAEPALRFDPIRPIPEVRARLRELLAGRVPDQVAADAELAVSELATNAVLHGGGHPTVTAWLDDHTLVLEAADQGPGPDDPFAELRLPGDAPGGRGIWLVGQLADAVGYGPTADGCAVRARFTF